MIDANATPEMAAHAGALLDDRVEVMLPVPAHLVEADLATGQSAFSQVAIAARDARVALDVITDASRTAQSLSSTDLAKAIAARSRTSGPAFDARGDAIAPSFEPYSWRDGAWRPAR